jgi:hypothetical protein
MLSDNPPLQFVYTGRNRLAWRYTPPRSAEAGYNSVCVDCWQLQRRCQRRKPAGLWGRGPPGRRGGRELQALSNSLQLTSP